MLRKRFLAAATTTILALGMSVGGVGVAFASIDSTDGPLDSELGSTSVPIPESTEAPIPESTEAPEALDEPLPPQPTVVSPFVRVTFICVVQQSGQVTQAPGDWNSGDVIFRYRHESGPAATFTSGVGGAGLHAGSIGVGEVQFLAAPSAINAVSVATDPGPNLSRGTASTNATKACTAAVVVPQQFNEVGFYVYQKRDVNLPAAWANSLEQTFIAAQPGTDWFTEFPGVLPATICGPGWAVQQDLIKHSNADGFVWPTTITHPNNVLSKAGVFVRAQHQELGSFFEAGVPDCAPLVPLAICESRTDGGIATDLNANGWTIPESARFVEGGIVLSVDGGWHESYISRAFNGTLADLGSGTTFTASPSQFVGIHVVTSAGTLVFEQEPTYDGKWWSTSDSFESPSGLGYATFDTLENLVVSNPEVTVSEIRVLYTHPEESSATITLVSLGCADYTFDAAEIILPTLPLVSPSAVASMPTCPAPDGTLTLSDTEGVTWMMNGVVTTPGTHQMAAGSTAKVVAMANEGFGFDDVQTEWNVDFAVTEVCPLSELPTLSLPETQLDTLAFTGTSVRPGAAGLAALAIILAGVGLVAARRGVEV